jgi:hypothetical protein
VPDDKKRSVRQVSQSDYMEIRVLIEQINNGQTSSGYNPLPCEQHIWQMDSDNPPMNRLWGWMIAHTVAMGHRTAYATSRRTFDESKQAWIPGYALMLKHVAKDLGGDPANWYRTWRSAVRRGWARNGTDEEGCDRLYLTGKVPKGKRETTSAHSLPGEWPAHVMKYYAEWPEDKQSQFKTRMQQKEELARILAATLMQSSRETSTEEEDFILQEFGIPPNRQVHAQTCSDCRTKGSHAPDCLRMKEEEERRKLVSLVRPTLTNFVQTVREYVQLQKNDTVHSENGDASLLPFQSSTEKGNRSVEPLPRNRPEKPYDEKKASPKKQLPALQKAPPLSAHEKQAVDLVFAEVGRMQEHEAFRHMEFTREKISSARKSDQLFACAVVGNVGPENVGQFFAHMWGILRKLDKNALGKKPGSAPAPRSLGLIWKESEIYGKRLDPAAKLEAEAAERFKTRQIQQMREILADPAETADWKFIARQKLAEYSATEN